MGQLVVFIAFFCFIYYFEVLVCFFSCTMFISQRMFIFIFILCFRVCFLLVVQPGVLSSSEFFRFGFRGSKKLQNWSFPLLLSLLVSRQWKISRFSRSPEKLFFTPKGPLYGTDSTVQYVRCFFSRDDVYNREAVLRGSQVRGTSLTNPGSWNSDRVPL